MSKPLERYQKLWLKESLGSIHRYPLVCKELSLILRGAYRKVSKNVQSLIFQDTLTASALMQTRSAVSEAHLLLQSVEATLPKQKKNLAVTEYKNAMVAHKRRAKARQEENGNSLSKKLKSSRGYCRYCKTIVWLDNTKCTNEHIGLNSEKQKIDPVSPSQVVEYLVDDSVTILSSSESDSDSDTEAGPFLIYGHMEDPRQEPEICLSSKSHGFIMYRRAVGISM